MEPRIQYAKTSDGVSIAYWKLGEGLPIVLINNLPWSHVREEWNWPQYRLTYEWVLQRAAVVRYDHRGCGLSDRDVGPLTLGAYAKDLEAVVDRLGLERAVVIGSGHGSCVAAAYAAEHAERVSHLVLIPAYLKGAEIYDSPAGNALRALRDKDWNIYTEAMARIVAGFTGAEDERSRAAAFYRSCVSQEGCLAAHRAIEAFDLTEIATQIRVPTLVLYRTGMTIPTVEQARAAAAAIPGAELVIFEPGPDAGWFEEESAYVSSFVGLETPVSSRARDAERAAPPSGTAVILFADIADSTGLTEQLGDTAFRDRSRALDETLRAVIRETGGRPIEGKLLGDGLMAVFASAREAIECALRCSDASAAMDLRLHLGLHAGDVLHEADNVYGGAVNIASRVAGASEPGEVLVSDIVRGLARTSAEVSFLDRGERELKGVSDPVRLYEVRWRE